MAMESALAEVFGVPASLDGVPLGGMLDRRIARLALAAHRLPDTRVDAGLDRALDLVARRYRDLVADGERRSWVLPGVHQLLSALNARPDRALVGTLTGNAEGVGRHKLTTSGLDHHVRVGAWGCEAEERSALVPLAVSRASGLGVSTRRGPSSVVLVGDTPRDVEAGHAAGHPVIGVATGRWNATELAAAGADEVLPDLTRPSALLSELTGLGELNGPG